MYSRHTGEDIGNRYGPGTGSIILDDVHCVGNETSIADCPHGGWKVHDCGHGEDVSVSCGTSSHLLITATHITPELTVGHIL